MDDRRQLAFGMTEPAEQPLDAVEHQIDALLGCKRRRSRVEDARRCSSAALIDPWPLARVRSRR